MEITIRLMQKTDAADLLRFESINREFFETMVPSRGDDYYAEEVFAERHQELLKEQEAGLSKFYLINNSDREIVGRINLVDIDRINNVAEIGFRVGANHVGKGIANKALAMLLNTKLDVSQIRGKTTTVNRASQKTLERNGFEKLGVSNEEFEMNGQLMSFVHYLWQQKIERRVAVQTVRKKNS